MSDLPSFASSGDLGLQAAHVCEAAALAAYDHIGRGDEKAADGAAATAMREALNTLNIEGLVVIGEVASEEAPLIHVGERVGRGVGPRIDIALDPLEGATLTAKAMGDALSVLAFAPMGGLMRAPDAYMDKIAIGPGYPSGLIDLDAPAAENVRALARARGIDPSEVRVCVLDRPRHADIIASLRSVGAKVLLLADGDVAGVISTTNPAAHVDLYLGQGGAPEGVLACAALKCAGGQFQGRFVRRGEPDKARFRRSGVAEADARRTYDLDELVSGDLVFAATGVTTGQLLDGVRKRDGFVHTHTLLMTSSSRLVREIRSKRAIDG